MRIFTMWYVTYYLLYIYFFVDFVFFCIAVVLYFRITWKATVYAERFIPFTFAHFVFVSDETEVNINKIIYKLESFVFIDWTHGYASIFSQTNLSRLCGSKSPQRVQNNRKTWLMTCEPVYDDYTSFLNSTVSSALTDQNYPKWYLKIFFP